MVIAQRLDRGQRHPSSQHRSTEAVGPQGHAEPVGALGQSLKRAGGGVHPVVPKVGFGCEAQRLSTLEHGVGKGREASGLRVGAS